ncbi:MAG: calcium/sodium antiporter [Desulfobacula sp.]|uniref:calcium/sodium antiporter n=1 Tax=Desulfobacula sp. TaxID=2593537 RepID=UPI0025C4FB87|nr:calcium/sodium antiporter [Desulfobacula sp.]MCD4719902.1 calcium/sodium antiporter [Desulfobacula sp.]
MQHSIWQWIGDEALLSQAVSGLSTPMLIIVIIVCIILLSKGADWMIDGVVDLAKRTGIPKIVIGATLISLGTTMPEAFVSVMAAFMGNPGLALGNGVGSIIADTGLIFGLTCVLAGAVPANKFILNRTGWVQVGSATLLVVIALSLLIFSTGTPILGRSFGIFFLILLAIYMYATYIWSKSGGAQLGEGENNDDNDELIGMVQCWLMVIGGLFLVVLGARVLVPCASEIAMRFGVPDDVIAATMVAFGTSLPELMTAISAIKKGHPEITVGNIVGADVLNCLFVIGAAATAKPLAIPENFYFFHFPAMLIILWSFRAFITMNKDGRFKRWQGIYLVGIYLSYVILQFALNVELPA